jgi:subtilase family serine protease
MAGHAQAQSMMTRHVRPEVTSGRAKFLNSLPGTQIMRLDLVLPLRDQAGLENFLREVYDPKSLIYRHFLTVPEFTERFGPTPEDYDAVVGFAKASGLRVVGGSRDGLDVQVEGSVTNIEAAFNVSMGVYQHPTEGRAFFAPDREPTVPLPFPLWHISGLDNYSFPRPALVHRNVSAEPNTTTGSCPSKSYCGSDMRAAYYGSGPLNGAGQSVGLIEFYNTNLADVNLYFTNAGQTNTVPINLICTGLCLSSRDDTEQTLDITQAISMAPGMKELDVFIGLSDTSILSAMSTHSPLDAQLSNSWTWNPADPSTDDPYFKKFAAQGQNFFTAAGDSGAYNSTSTYVYPADDAYITSVGGTDLYTTGPGGAWSSETAWADGGGGISPDDIPIPSWQAPAINATNLGSATYRNSPDVAAEANFDFYVCADGSCTANYWGGTSFAAPMWAGYMALVNQQAVANGNALLGFINPLIYPLGLGSGYGAAFHDITSGSNGYPAVTGYDLATGWGSPNGPGLINALAGVPSAANFTISASPASVSVVQGNDGTSTITAAVSGGFDSAIALSASGQPSGVAVVFSFTSIAAPGSGTSTMTMVVPSNTATGVYPITVTGLGEGITQQTTVTLTVTASATPNFTISASPTSVAPGNNGTSTITTTVSGGFNSAIVLSASGQPSGVTVSFNPTSIAAPGSGTSTMTVAVSPNTAIGVYPITVAGTGGNITQQTTFTLTVAAPANFSISASSTLLGVFWGKSNSSTITTAGVNGFNSSISLSASGQPKGVTVSFTLTSIPAPGSGTSTMQVTASSGSAVGRYVITITGTGGGITNTTTISLLVLP